ncbi:DNA translocase FtsK 4TM domain-containing protein [Sphingomonas solaris]|uniref:DNA translocase FtsK n=1 Tax=Alterirhizorhabdus solaris TaxID=2529389 RepID=A0A558R339_9SPHN|nr:DNA translocase FtsK 4TM domain-containing protein [Sphingomonas solaris]TVV73787.1 DNA translocase FtsK [Sphingomonas solaris]
MAVHDVALARGNIRESSIRARGAVRRAAVRGTALAGAAALLTLVLLLAVALASYSPTDPSLNTAAEGPARNLLGLPGATAADLLLSLLGPAAALLLPLVLLIGLRLWRGASVGHWKRSLGIATAAIVIFDVALALLRGGSVAGLPGGWGGGIGLAGAGGIEALIGLVPGAPVQAGIRIGAILLFGLGGLALGAWGLGLDAGERGWLFRRDRFSREPRVTITPSMPVEPETAVETTKPAARQKIAKAGKPLPRPAVSPDAETSTPPTIREPIARPAQEPRERKTPASNAPDTYTLPPIDLLAEPPPNTGQVIDRASLERNARLLETVLDDFHVKGRITEIRPGPVVTMYELEPASGIKASRVISLADDIARNMSALSARVATIPGRSVIGIELPNQKREAVMLRELVDSEGFESSTAQLPIILGKNIAGDPVITDLAPMPHLLIAGTTGSGKSVGLNTMIVSLLYRLTPEQCRMIMIDPKMLELSVYDGIPHLLSPVVTEPAKAIRALKWAVEQMEDRYRMMASIGVRGLGGFNDSVRAAKAKGKPITRRVQTGYDGETGQPIYEEETLEFEPLPQIVVVVDELADLMMTAGKEVEFLIQRLAQKARAAGIHLIMATQRPSVDVITGVIKANLPTRISFAVTSKIDSRTILGEQGAEQLLGKGDMLYMPGGKQIARVHGPFVSDDEVRAIADHWRGQGTPDYISAVTEEPLEGAYEIEGAPTGPDDPETQVYRRAVQLVVENRKASTSWLQRQLRVGYNSAARLIERMEKEGIIGTPDHVGRREVLFEPADLASFWS